MTFRLRIAHQSAVVKACRADAAFVQEGGELPSAEEKRLLREELATALRENILTHEERELFTYRGFRVVLPANMDVRAPFVWLCREGRYHVEMSTKANYLHNNQQILESTAYTLNEQIVAIEECDLADAITSFSWAQYCYNAALKMGNSMLSESLMDFLR